MQLPENIEPKKFIAIVAALLLSVFTVTRFAVTYADDPFPSCATSSFVSTWHDEAISAIQASGTTQLPPDLSHTSQIMAGAGDFGLIFVISNNEINKAYLGSNTQSSDTSHAGLYYTSINGTDTPGLVLAFIDNNGHTTSVVDYTSAVAESQGRNAKYQLTELNCISGYTGFQSSILGQAFCDQGHNCPSTDLTQTPQTSFNAGGTDWGGSTIPPSDSTGIFGNASEFVGSIGNDIKDNIVPVVAVTGFIVGTSLVVGLIL